MRRDLVGTLLLTSDVSRLIQVSTGVLRACVAQGEFHGPRRHSFNSAVIRRHADVDASISSSSIRWLRNSQTTQRPVEVLPANDDLQRLRLSSKSRVSRKFFTQFCEKFHQVDTKNYINYSKTTKTTYCLSTFRLHAGSLHQD